MFDEQSGILILGRDAVALQETAELLAKAIGKCRVTRRVLQPGTRATDRTTADVVVFDMTAAQQADVADIKTMTETIPVMVVANGPLADDVGHDRLVRGAFDHELLRKSLMYAVERHGRLEAEKRMLQVMRTMKVMRRQLSTITNEVRATKNSFANLCTAELFPADVR